MMKRFWVFCLVLLTSAGLTLPAYADVIVVPEPTVNGGLLLAIVLVALVLCITVDLLRRFRKKK